MRKYFWPSVVIILALLVIFGGALVGLWTDWLWFKDLGFGVVFSTIFWTRIKVGLLFGFLFFAIIYSNLWYARKIAPPPSPLGLERQLIERLGHIARRGIGLVLFGGSIVLAAMVGLEAATHWQEWLMFRHAAPFHAVDPVFGRDIGFYVFRLPFLDYLYHWLFFALGAAAVATIGLHYADEAIEFFGNRLQFAPKAKAHVAVLIALLFFLKAWGYKLSAYALMYGQGKLFDGPGYTDIHVRIPAFNILIFVAIVAGVMILVNIWRRGVGVAIAGLALLVAASLVLGSAWPLMTQSLNVKPNELEKETPYISRAIQATRVAYGLDKIDSPKFAAEDTLTPEQVQANSATIENIRLWDKGHLLQVYGQIQTIQQFYEFYDVDVDRYWLTEAGQTEKRYRQVWLSARELNQQALPAESQTWVNKHLQYTHGYGVVMSPVNRVNAKGLPEFFIKDIPPVKSVDLALDRMQIYFGELTDEYVYVKTHAGEFDYPNRPKRPKYGYEGSGGIGAGGLFRRLLFSLRFGDVNIMLNNDITSNSRLLFRREIRERTETLMPFLQFDGDPYLVTVEGKLYWMRDGYTTTDTYPYSRHFGDMPGSPNYLRNSVKVVVDAYTGAVRAYLVEKPLRDPIIETYNKVFPGVFKPLSEMPAALREHIRYPEDLFRVQTMIYSRYHMLDPVKFYNNSELWDIPAKPTIAGASEGGQSGPLEPYYVIMKLPNGKNEEFILMTPYKRAGKQNMVAWMCARCDSQDYGRLLVYTFPQWKNVYGPGQIASQINGDPTISSQLTLWNKEGSRVEAGNMLVIPIDHSLLYVLPIYLVATDTPIPAVKRVIVALGDNIAMEPTLEEALAQVVGGKVSAQPAPAQPTAQPGAPAPALSAGVRALVQQAADQLQAAESAQREGDWAAYGEQLKALRATLKELQSRSK